MITKKALQKIKENQRCRNRLALEMGVTEQAVLKWLKKNSIMLTTAKALSIIEKETGLSETDILEKEKTHA